MRIKSQQYFLNVHPFQTLRQTTSQSSQILWLYLRDDKYDSRSKATESFPCENQDQKVAIKLSSNNPETQESIEVNKEIDNYHKVNGKKETSERNGALGR